MILSYFYWDPSPAMFDVAIPFLGRPILWYGFFFAFGFFVGYWILRYVLIDALSDPKKTRVVADRMILYVILGAVIGARLGDVLFYQNLSMYAQDPLGVIKIWEGGLASHGGTLGILLALFILTKRPKKGVPTLSYLSLLDISVIPTGLVASFIRIGNFFNQEILGKPTDLPWAVIFGHPADGSVPQARHPVQLYESLYYFVVFLGMLLLWKRLPKWRETGKMCGLFLLLVFVFRFFIEIFKEEQSEMLSHNFPISMGQILSIPFIILGAFLLFKRKKRHQTT
jgi:phosphatidylglycerol:prolipoprotein diacylglycerol transferase